MTNLSISHYLKLIAIELTAITALALAVGSIEITYNNYLFFEKLGERLFPALVSFTPILFFYVLLRLFFKIPLAIALVLIFYFVLIQVGAMKQALTAEPLSWTDISSPINISIAWHYTELVHLLYLLLPVGFGYFALKLKQVRLPTRNSLIFSVLTLSCLLPIAFYPYVDKINERLGNMLESKFVDMGVIYYSWDWDHNLKAAGLPMHLIQTSQREIPRQPTELERKQFFELHDSNAEILLRPKNIIFILCEACWYNDDHFENEFRPLQNLGFKAFRAISPVYGGGTVNASFELLTGLPSHGALTGVIYQEYAELIKDEAIAFPRALKNTGYQTIAAHNHTKKFWKRDLVKPKLGFDNFWGREHMAISEKFFADDEILYERALADLKSGGEPKFLFLTTVYTHGGYSSNNDYGEKDYSTRLRKSIASMAKFVGSALKVEPNTAILIVGDHMPSLTKFFYENSIFPKSLFEQTGDRNDDFKFKPKPPRSIVGDVPVFFYYPDKKRADEFADVANASPFYCMVNLFDQAFVGVNLQTFAYLRKSDICNRIDADNYYQMAKTIPEYIFSAAIIK